MFKGLSNLATMMRQAQQMGGKLEAIQDQLREQRAIGSAGGGMVEVEMNGLSEVLRCKIDPVLVENGEREMIEDLLPAAMNQAQTKAKQLHLEAMKAMTAGMDVPGLDEAISQMTGGNSGQP